MESKAKDSGYLHGLYADKGESLKDNPFPRFSHEGREWKEGFQAAQSETVLDDSDLIEYVETQQVDQVILLDQTFRRFLSDSPSTDGLHTGYVTGWVEQA